MLLQFIITLWTLQFAAAVLMVKKQPNIKGNCFVRVHGVSTVGGGAVAQQRAQFFDRLSVSYYHDTFFYYYYFYNWQLLPQLEEAFLQHRVDLFIELKLCVHNDSQICDMLFDE